MSQNGVPPQQQWANQMFVSQMLRSRNRRNGKPPRKSGRLMMILIVVACAVFLHSHPQTLHELWESARNH